MTTPVAFRAQEELDNIREYFEDRQDASMEPGEDRFHGNKEMSLLQDLEKVEKSIKALCNAISEASSAYAILAESKGLNATDPMAHAAAILRAERDEAMKYAGRRFVEGMKYAQELLRTNGFEKSALALDHEIARAALAKGVERDENGCIQYERQIGEDAKPGNEIGAFKEWFLRWGAEKERRPISTDWFGYRDLQAAFEAGQKLHSIGSFWTAIDDGMPDIDGGMVLVTKATARQWAETVSAREVVHYTEQAKKLAQTPIWTHWALIPPVHSQ